MTATAHALTGAAIISRFPNLFGLFLAFLSHFPLDFIPHWDTFTNSRRHSKTFCFITTTFDVLLGLFLVYHFFSKLVPLPLLFAASFFAQLPDWFAAPYYFFKINLLPFRFFFFFHRKFHHRLDLPLRLLTQIIVIILLFLLLNIIPH